MSIWVSPKKEIMPCTINDTGQDHCCTILLLVECEKMSDNCRDGNI